MRKLASIFIIVSIGISENAFAKQVEVLLENNVSAEVEKYFIYQIS